MTMISIRVLAAHEMAALNVWVNVILIILIPLVATKPPPLSLWNPRIINGTEAVASNTRHQVSVRMKSREIIFGTGHICGGSLIAPTLVLSAAHCFYDDDEEKFYSARNYFVVMGTLDRFEPNNFTISYNITHIVYPAFNRTTFENDLALIFLDGSVPETNPAVSVIELNKKVIPVGAMCQVTGWGAIETTVNPMNAEKLMTVDVPIIDRKTCSTNYGEGSIVDGMICAGYMEGGKDACQGDSGGPMVHNGKLVGVVSFGDGCAQPGFPGVYTDVRHYVDWIEKSSKSGLSTRTMNGLVAILSLILTWFLT